MDHLWAPWRMDYIMSDKVADSCVFCPGDDRSKDEERLILYKGEMSMVMMNRYPYNSGHLLIIPNSHVQDLDQLSDKENMDLSVLLKNTVSIMKQIMDPEGFNIGLNMGKAAGAGIEAHLHYHIVPRWNGDVNYITAISETRVVPEYLNETYKKFRPYFEKLVHS